MKYFYLTCGTMYKIKTYLKPSCFKDINGFRKKVKVGTFLANIYYQSERAETYSTDVTSCISSRVLYLFTHTIFHIH